MKDLKKRRLAIGISQRELARRCCRSVFFISAVENGKKSPSAEMVDIIEKALDSSVRHPNRKLKHGQKRILPFASKEEEDDLKRIYQEKYASRPPSWVKQRSIPTV